LFTHFDQNDDKLIDYQEFLMAVRGPMSELRRNCINSAFDSIDRDGNGTLEFSDLEGLYSGDKHPEVMAGRMTSQ